MPVYFLALLFLMPDWSSEENKLRAKDSTFAGCLEYCGLEGVLDGVGSMPEGLCELDELVGSELGAGSSNPRAAAAFAVPSAVNEPETRRLVSTGGCRFLRGDGTGETMAALLRLLAFFDVRGVA